VVRLLSGSFRSMNLQSEYKADDFVMLDWTQEDTEVPGDNTHLWEESWDDDDTSEDFSAQLK
jgi:26 proteasome complex subunit DSS1